MLKQVIILIFGAFITNELLATDEQYPDHYAGKPNSGQLNEMAWSIYAMQQESGLEIPDLDIRGIIKVGYCYARLSSVVYALQLATQKEINAATLDKILNSFAINTVNPSDGVTIRWRENALKQDRAPNPREYAQMWHDVLRCEIEDGNEIGNPQALHCADFLSEQKGIVERFLAAPKTVAKSAEKKPTTNRCWPCVVL
ncbi:MAG: hypothetical protein NT128_04550 [Proteobacteria bacterium]|nr:hypothetical protein [Pseudomonadota bacterium]